jgi:hypothetical protein
MLCGLWTPDQRHEAAPERCLFCAWQTTGLCRRGRFPPRAPVALRVAEAGPETETFALDRCHSLYRKSVSNEIVLRERTEPHQSLSTKVVLHAFLVPLRAAHHTPACVGIMSSSICCHAAACRLICSRRWITFSMRRSNSRAPRHSRSSVGRSVGKGIGPGLGPICRRLSPDARKPLVYHLRRTGPGDTQPNSTARVAKTIQTSDLHGSARMPRSALESSAPAVTEELNRTPRRLPEATAQEVSLTVSLTPLAESL